MSRCWWWEEYLACCRFLPRAVVREDDLPTCGLDISDWCQLDSLPRSQFGISQSLSLSVVAAVPRGRLTLGRPRYGLGCWMMILANTCPTVVVERIQQAEQECPVQHEFGFSLSFPPYQCLELCHSLMDCRRSSLCLCFPVASQMTGGEVTLLRRRV